MGCSRASCSPILSQAMDTKNKSSVCTLLLKATPKLGSAQRRHHVHVISALPTGFLALRMSLSMCPLSGPERQVGAWVAVVLVVYS